MNVIRHAIKNAAVGVAIADDAEDMKAILKDGCAAVIWRRQALPEFQRWLDNLRPEQLPQFRTVLPLQEIPETLAHHCDQAGLTGEQHCQRLIGDMFALASVFSKITDAPMLRIRLDVVRTDACHKFHQDISPLRLICTYRGPGTQYGVSSTGADPSRVFSVPTGAPMIMRGAENTNGPKSGLLHRSPPIDGTGQTRLVYVLDPAEDPEAVT